MALGETLDSDRAARFRVQCLEDHSEASGIEWRDRSEPTIERGILSEVISHAVHDEFVVSNTL